MARRADSGRHAAGDEAGEIERNILVDYDDRSLVHHGEFGKTADHAEGTDVNPVAIAPPVSAVELRPLGYARTFGAEMMETQAAPAANAAGRDESQDHVVPRAIPPTEAPMLSTTPAASWPSTIGRIATRRSPRIT